MPNPYRRPTRCRVRNVEAGLLALMVLASACHGQGTETGARGEPTAQAVRRAIAMRYEHQAAAYARRDIDAFLDNLEPDFRGEPLRGPASDKATVAEAVRARMASVDSSEIQVVIDSLSVRGDTAEVYNTQRFSRLVRGNDGVARRVVTTQRHFERWRRTPRGWRIFFLRELGQGSSQA
jgi:hypothetical protein